MVKGVWRTLPVIAHAYLSGKAGNASQNNLYSPESAPKHNWLLWILPFLNMLLKYYIPLYEIIQISPYSYPTRTSIVTSVRGLVKFVTDFEQKNKIGDFWTASRISKFSANWVVWGTFQLLRWTHKQVLGRWYAAMYIGDILLHIPAYLNLIYNVKKYRVKLSDENLTG